MNIILDADTSDCPCAVCKILNATETKSILVQVDYDACGVASSFGWSVKDVVGAHPCEHDGTDGTIDCKTCGVKAMQFIESAIDYINSNDGKVAEDPGYFDE